MTEANDGLRWRPIPPERRLSCAVCGRPLGECRGRGAALVLRCENNHLQRPPLLPSIHAPTELADPRRIGPEPNRRKPPT